MSSSEKESSLEERAEACVREIDRISGVWGGGKSSTRNQVRADAHQIILAALTKAQSGRPVKPQTLEDAFFKWKCEHFNEGEDDNYNGIDPNPLHCAFMAGANHETLEEKADRQEEPVRWWLHFCNEDNGACRVYIPGAILHECGGRTVVVIETGKDWKGSTP